MSSPRKALVIGFVAGAVGVTCALSLAAPRGSFRRLDLFARVLSLVEQNYVEEVNEETLIQGAVRGMMRTLDPHSSYLTPSEFAEVRADTDGEFGGVGVEVDDTRGGTLIVRRTLPDTPAARAGILVGDLIVSVDGKPLVGGADDDPTTRLRGRPGTRVVVELVRSGTDAAGQKEVRESIAMVREIIRVRAAEWSLLEPGIGHIRIRQFQERTDAEVEEALAALTRESKKPLAGLVLDLRDNPGGLFDQAVRVADLFLESGVIVATRGRGGRHLEQETARQAGTHAAIPIVCLVNGDSASAAEILAGALQDHDRALVLGTRTFGKGSVQSLIPLEDGSGLKLTVARYFTPKGRVIQEHGIDPDLVVEQIPAADLEAARRSAATEREEDLERHLAGDKPSAVAATPPSTTHTDYQLEMARQTLRAWHRFGQPPLRPAAQAQREPAP